LIFYNRTKNNKNPSDLISLSNNENDNKSGMLDKETVDHFSPKSINFKTDKK